MTLGQATRYKRRATDRAQERMYQAATKRDRVAWTIALGQYEAAAKRRAEWAGAAK